MNRRTFGAAVPHTRRTILLGGLAAYCALPCFNRAQAQSPSAAYPSRPIKVVVPLAAGGSADAVMRLLSPALSRRLGQSVVIENRGGAGCNVGMDAVARSEPDGYTLAFMVQSVAVNPYLYKAIPFDIATDFTPIGLANQFYQALLVNRNSDIKSLADLVSRAKARPNTLSFGTSGAGGLSHLATEKLMKAAGIKMIHVPYKGIGPALADLLGGQIDVMFDVVSSAKTHIRAGKLRPLAVASLNRLKTLPDVPALSETYPGFALSGWMGLAAPKGVPIDRLARLSREFIAVMQEPSVREALLSADYDVPANPTPEAFARLIREELTRYRELTLAIGLKAE